MKIAVTGSSGFIGSYLVKALKELGIELILLDIQAGVDVCDWDAMKDVKADVFIHLANKSFVPDSYQQPKSFYEVNISSTLHVLELCRLNQAKLIFLSSYIYGHPQYQPIDEKHPIQAFNPYAQTKVICEQMCEGYNRDFNVPITIFRPFNIYGNGQNPDFLIPTIIKQAKDGRIEIKDNRPKRDFIHVNDVVAAIISAIDFETKDGFNVLNLGSGKSYSVNEIVATVMDIMGGKIEYNCLHIHRPNEVMDTIADISKLQQMGWQPKVSFRDGLKSMIE